MQSDAIGFMSSLREFTRFNALDPRTPTVIILLWMIIVTIVTIAIGFTDSVFFSWGPNNNISFFKTPIDTWGKYVAIIIYTVINQAIQTYGLETISPWMINVVENRKETRLPFGENQSLFVIVVWYTYLWSGRIIGIQLMLTQFDLLLVILASDLITTVTITKWYMKDKSARRRESSEDYTDTSSFVNESATSEP